MFLLGLVVFNCFIRAYYVYEYFEVNYTDISEPYFLKPVQVNEPCESFEPITLNNFSPSLRISEKKCLEYIVKVQNMKREENWIERFLGHNTRIKRNNKEEFQEVPAIFGGKSAVTNEFPHMGAIGWKAKDPSIKWVFKCGSSLISEKFLLTAAHCSKLSPRSVFDVIQREPEIVRLGGTDISNDEIRVNRRLTDTPIKRIILHPKYASPKKYYDIALVELHEEVKFVKSLHPACLWPKHDYSELGNKVMLTGWGYTEHGHLSKILQVTTVPVLETSVCERLLRPYHNRNWHGFQNHQICAGELAGGIDTCQGDSGGPIQIKMKWIGMYWILGVTSFGINCGHINRPGIYTRVSSFIAWIEDVVWEPTK